MTPLSLEQRIDLITNLSTEEFEYLVQTLMNMMPEEDARSLETDLEALRACAETPATSDPTYTRSQLKQALNQARVKTVDGVRGNTRAVVDGLLKDFIDSFWQALDR